jgi:hypothetical protein
LTETKEQHSQRLLNELEGKNIAHYSVLLAAWIQTRLEHDRTLVTLSVAAIGLLVTILTTVGITESWHIAPYLVSFAAFSITIYLCLQLYEKNSNKLRNEIAGPDNPSYENISLKKYDIWSYRSFLVGVISAACIGILSATSQLASLSKESAEKSSHNASVLEAKEARGHDSDRENAAAIALATDGNDAKTSGSADKSQGNSMEKHEMNSGGKEKAQVKVPFSKSLDELDTLRPSAPLAPPTLQEKPAQQQETEGSSGAESSGAKDGT